MWFFSKKAKQDATAGPSEILHAPVKVHTMADDLAEKSRKQLPDLPKESRSPKSLSDDASKKRFVLMPSSLKANPSSEEPSTPELASMSKESTPKQSRFSIGTKPKPAPIAPIQPSSQPSPIETSPFLGAASSEVSVGVSPEQTSSNTSQDVSLPENTAKKMTSVPLEPAVLPEKSEEIVPLQHLEKKQAELRTGNWPVNDEKKIKQSVINPPDVTDSSDVFSGPKHTSFSGDNVIIAEEPVGKKTMLALIVVMLLAAAGGGSYYFWQTKVQHAPIEIPSALRDVLPQKGEVDVLEESSTVQLPFSLNESNLFVVDVETETISVLREKLLDDARKMQEADMRVPVRFTVVDKSNTPIAFFIFASVFNLGLSGDLLNSLGNDFSLYLYLDNGTPRLGLTVTYKDVELARTLLKSSEKTLPISLKNLFLDENVPIGSDIAFGNGLYESVPTRFFNLDVPESLSIDYAFMRDYLVIGTSRDTARALIDEVLKP